MGKVFVHKPLKRAELRRLSEEPRPVEASPGPFVARLEAKPDPDKERRAQERLAQRETMRLMADMVAKYADELEVVTATSMRFVRWLLDAMPRRGGLQEFLGELNLLPVLESQRPCMVCRRAESARYTSLIVIPRLVSERDQSLVGLLCSTCSGLAPRLYARMIARSVINGTQPEHHFGKLKLGANDWQFLDWLKQPRAEDDRSAIGKALDSGTFGDVLSNIERLIGPGERLGRSVHHQPRTCLQCGEALNRATGVGHSREPRAGSISICIACGYIQAYGEGGGFRELNEVERARVEADSIFPTIERARTLIKP